MKQIKKGWVIQNGNGDYLTDEMSDDDWGLIFDATVFKLKREAQKNINDAGVSEDDGETVVKVEITKMVIIL